MACTFSVIFSMVRSFKLTGVVMMERVISFL